MNCARIAHKQGAADENETEIRAWQPGHLNLAERLGFEPRVGYKPTHAFQACALNHSAISPASANPLWGSRQRCAMFFHSRGEARTPLTRLLNPPVLCIDNAISPLYEEYAISPLRHLHRGSPLCPEHRPACASKIWRSAPDGGLGEAFHNQRIRFRSEEHT